MSDTTSDFIVDDGQEWVDDPVGELNDETAKTDEKHENPNQDIDLDFSFDAPPQEDDNETDEVRALKAELAEVKRKNEEWERKNAPQAPTLRPMPNPIDYDYDEDKYLADMDVWLKERDEYNKAMEEQNAPYFEAQNRFVASRNKLIETAKDYEQVEIEVGSQLSEEYRDLIKMAVKDNPALLVYRLGKSPNELARLKSLSPIDFVVEVALLNERMKNQRPTKSKKPSPKEHELTGSAGGKSDVVLAQLQAEANKTGDYTKLIRYKTANGIR